VTDVRPSTTMRAGSPGMSVGAVRVRIPFRHPFATATGTWLVRDAWIVRIEDAAGRIGFGEASLDPGAGPEAHARLAEEIHDAADEVAHAGTIEPWLVVAAPATGAEIDPERRAVRAAIAGAALDLGWVDLAEPRDGPATPAVRVNATIPTEELGPTVALAREALSAGFTCLKIKGGGERSGTRLVERLAAVRSAVGPDIDLRLDVNGAWDTSTATDRLGALAAARLGLEYVEQPIPPGDPAMLADLRRSTSIRIAVDESVASRPAARDLLEAEAVDVLVVKPSRVGGPLDALAIARDAVSAGVEVTISTLLETGIGLTTALRVAAALPGDPRHEHAHGLATADLLVSDVLREPLSVDRGRLPLPVREPGGATIVDAEAIERFAIDWIGWPR
jgi:o-succinylbenzoate synthase